MAIGIGVTWLITFDPSGSRTWLFFHGSTALVGHGLPIAKVSRTHSDTHTSHSVELPWTSDGTVAVTSI